MVYYVQTAKQWKEHKLFRDALRGGGRSLPTEAQDKDDTVRRNVEWLLEHLFSFDAELGSVYTGGAAILPTQEWLRLGHESINWGDLGASVEKHGRIWLIYLEEAAPGSVNLCRYVQEWMTAWGWPCKVSAEW